MVRDWASDAWTGVTAGVLKVLDWLECRLEDGVLPCFFWPEVNLLEPVSKDEREAMGRTVVLMRTRAISVLITHCLENFSLDPVLEGGSEVLSEPELRLSLAQQMTVSAVIQGTIYRPTAPCWSRWQA